MPPSRPSVRAIGVDSYLGVGGGGDIGCFLHEFNFRFALDSPKLCDLWRELSPLTVWEKLDEQVKLGHRGARVVVTEYAFRLFEGCKR